MASPRIGAILTLGHAYPLFRENNRVFGVSLPELIVIFVVVLIVFGPDKLPEIARSVGKWTGDLRRTSDSLRREFYHTVYNPVDSARREITQMKTDLMAMKPSDPAPPTGASTPSPALPPTTEPKEPSV